MFVVCQSHITIFVKFGLLEAVFYTFVLMFFSFLCLFVLHPGYNSIMEIFTVIHLHSTSFVKFGPVEAIFYTFALMFFSFLCPFLLQSVYNSILKIFTVIHLHSTSFVKFDPVEVSRVYWQNIESSTGSSPDIMIVKLSWYKWNIFRPIQEFPFPPNIVKFRTIFHTACSLWKISSEYWIRLYVMQRDIIDPRIGARWQSLISQVKTRSASNVIPRILHNPAIRKNFEQTEYIPYFHIRCLLLFTLLFPSCMHRWFPSCMLPSHLLNKILY